MKNIQPIPEEISQAVLKILEERDVFIDPLMVELVCSAMGHWLKDTKRGYEYMAHLLQLDSAQGSVDTVYKTGTKFFLPRDVLFLRGCIIKGEPYPVSLLEMEQAELKACESCGSRTFCVEQVHKMHICSHCAQHDEDKELQYGFDITCDECTYTQCQWYPSKHYKETLWSQCL